MRLAFRIDVSRIAPYVALCAVLCAAGTLIALPAGVNAAESVPIRFANPIDAADAGSATLASTTPAAAASPDTTAALATTLPESRQLAGEVPGIPADAASVNNISLDDQVLSRQRGGALGMVMVAATPPLLRGNDNSGGNSVTLWDEIAPPPPLPIPIDAARAAQGNVANYQRK